MCMAFYAKNLLAMQESYPEDLEESRKRCLISGFERDKLEGNTKGVVTLCYKPVGLFDFDHVALVFEMFLHESPDAISLRMVHYGINDVCCGFGGTERVWVEGEGTVLFKVHRRRVKRTTGEIIEEKDSAYVRHSSWIISNEDLLKGIEEAETDCTNASIDENAYNIKKKLKKGKDLQERAKLKLELEKLPSEKQYKGPHNCVEYVRRIMNIIGIETKFSWWRPNTPNHLKSLVDNHGDGKYLSPAPDRTGDDLPRYPYEKED
ncbi:MAG: hypothetical protein B7Y25_07880 [Alphaproteobacteria bacterium 16-39-46]|nr:MAG: hypothetical protein B7Y25_07880 [Alphaproteobacteria bacterium 16-39-46]OZA41383.1 MAG: hypothetical protein B7X84_08070 [Alphaproteobacteria bacterium 17-39-52]